MFRHLAFKVGDIIIAHSLSIVPFYVCLAPSSFPRTNEEMIRDVVDERTTARMKEQEQHGKVHD